jgi:hypothetical protein
MTSDTNTNSNADRPVNFDHLSDSFELAMKAHDDIPDEAVADILTTVEEACANNEQHLVWEHDQRDLVDRVGEVIDAIYEKYGQAEVDRISTTIEMLEPIEAHPKHTNASRPASTHSTSEFLEAENKG